jgi:hypothetical protein
VNDIMFFPSNTWHISNRQTLIALGSQFVPTQFEKINDHLKYVSGAGSQQVIIGTENIAQSWYLFPPG